MTAQGHTLELNHVDALRDAKAKMAELSSELEALRLAKTESGGACMPCSSLLIFRDAPSLYGSQSMSILAQSTAASFCFLFVSSAEQDAVFGVILGQVNDAIVRH